MKHGVTGVRGEALAGYPTIRTVILPYLRQTTTRGDLRYLQLMVHLMAQVEDANVLHRGGQLGYGLFRIRPKRCYMYRRPGYLMGCAL